MEEQSDGESEVEASGIVPDGRADELRMRLALIEAEERRMTAERERIEASRAAEREADERKMEATRAVERERLEAEKTRFEMDMRLQERKAELEIEVLRARAQLGVERADNGPPQTPMAGSSHGHGNSKLPAMLENEDPITYFHSFEKIAQLQGLAEETWSQLLPSLLNSAMRNHYTRLSYDACRDYRAVKAELLKCARMNAKYYLEKFRTMKRTGKENYSQLIYRIRDMLNYYLEAKHIDDFEKLKDDILIQKFMDSLPSETRYFVESRKPVDATAAGELADLHYECSFEPRGDKTRDPRSQPNNGKSDQSPKGGVAPTEAKKEAKGENPKARTTPKNGPGQGSNYERHAANNRPPNACWNCNLPGHSRSNCPLLGNNYNNGSYVSSVIKGLLLLSRENHFIFPEQ